MNDSLPQSGRLQRVLDFLARHRRVLALVSFGAGLASFLLIQRSERVAQWLALTLLLSWLAILLEGPLTRGRLPKGLLRFLVQGVHQETLFFALPFFFYTTSWGTPQAVFTGLLILAALAAMWDPFYFRVIAARRPLYLTFHALAIFVAMLVALPILLQLTTAQSMGLAAAGVGLFAVPGLSSVLDRQRLLHRALLLIGAVGLGALAWLGRSWIPPATLWVDQALVTQSVDVQSKSPGVKLVTVTPAQLHAQGLYAYTAIHAPRGLRERVFHRWLLDGREVDRIPMDIVGGREEGYRAWSHKREFPPDPRGDWRVDAITEGGQLIGSMKFQVLGEMPVDVPAPETIPALPPPPVESSASPTALPAQEAAPPSATETASEPEPVSPAP